MKRRRALFVPVTLSLAVVPFIIGCTGEGLSATSRSSGGTANSGTFLRGDSLGQSITTGSVQGYYWYDGPNGLNSGSTGTRSAGSASAGNR